MLRSNTWIIIFLNATLAVLLLSQFAQISVQQAPNASVSTNLTNSSGGVANDTIKNAFDSLRDTFGSQFVK